MRPISALPLLVGFMLSTLVATGVSAKMSMAQENQRDRMTECNHQASEHSMKGSDRSSFMSSCLKGESSKTGKALTPQQQKMKDCNATASRKSMKGDERRNFMSKCLKKS
jgi:hypothetical protein